MKNTLHTLFYCLVILAGPAKIFGQADCQLKDPVLSIDFGIGSSVRDPNATRHPNYQRVKESCPPDGFYAFADYTSNCFNNDWFTINGDHTGNGGNMMLVNASEDGGSFFSYAFFGLKPATKYEFATWLTNVCRINGGCSPLPPNILVVIKTLDGQPVAAFKTGQLTQTYNLTWQRFSAFFTTPAVQTSLLLTMTNETLGGCGNDFAMDDITFRECVPPEIVKVPAIEIKVETQFTNPPVTKTAAPKVLPPAKKGLTKTKPVAELAKKPFTPAAGVRVDSPLAIVAKPALSQPKITTQRTPAFNQPVPDILTKRENSLAKSLKTPPGTMTVDLYDNGQVDDDTVTIYHNNLLLVANARLSQKPISFSITINEKQPHHELVMVANNLGSIPPNTSLMIVKINGKRYDVFISSTEQKNARVVIDLEE
ncbi:MAG: hypothetical protein V4717_24000 [Bacteroidota bacterium]